MSITAAAVSKLSKSSFNSQELAAVRGISAIFMLRMLGLFALLPIFRDYAPSLAGTTPQWIGFTLGVYGLTQALFQIPCGLLSDRWGRRPVIALGLLLFILGSVVVALSTHIYGVAIGRALQGMGAIGAVLMVFLSDLTREEVCPRAMAWVGMGIGVSFVLAMLLAPPLSLYLGVPGLFWGMSVAGGLALLFLYRALPIPAHRPPLMMADLRPQAVQLFKNKAFLWPLLGVFILHAGLTGLFVFLPSWIAEHGFTKSQSWQFYLPVFFLGFVGTMRLLRLSEKNGLLGKMLAFSMIFFAASVGLLTLCHAFYLGLFLCSVLFFASFSLLEAGLPAWVSRVVDKKIKGTAMGIYATAQFLGIFAGGLLAGYLASIIF